MKKVGVITFHAAHNFGSVLQAYALQTFVEELSKDIQYEIINFRSEFQKEFYAPIKKSSEITNFIKNIMIIPYLSKYKVKYAKFEKFINKVLHITQNEFRSEDELKRLCPQYDYYISGSDQIWNVRAKDFNDCYYLSFTDSKNKIAYAPSFGPLKIDWHKYDKGKYAGYLKKYKDISVRENRSMDNIIQMINEECDILVDPTLLLTKKEWKRISSGFKPDFEYIFLYCLEPSRQLIKSVKEISKKLSLPVIVSRFNNKYDYINPFIKMYDAGPEDFISLIDNAKLVLTTSFHGTVFSVLFNKPFFTIDCEHDRRISNLLKMVGLEERNIGVDEVIKVNNSIFEIGFASVSTNIDKEREKSRRYLLNALEE